MRTTLHAAVLAGACLLAPTLGQAKTSKSFDITGSFAGEHGTKAQPTGNVTGHYDASKKSLTYSISYSGLSGPVMAAHFHGPAASTAEAGVLVPIKAPYASPISGHASLTTAEAKDLRDGMVYVNLHTAASPDGEARAQLSATPASP